MVPVLCRDSARAIALGRNPSWRAAASTRAAAASENEPLPLMTREAVPTPTPASFATSLIVAMAETISAGEMPECAGMEIDAFVRHRVEHACAFEIHLHANAVADLVLAGRRRDGGQALALHLQPHHFVRAHRLDQRHL